MICLAAPNATQPGPASSVPELRGQGAHQPASAARGIPEQGDRGDVIVRCGRQRLREPEAGQWCGGDDVDHGRTLGVAAEHQPRGPARAGHLLNVVAGVVRAVSGGQEITVGRVVDSVCPDALVGLLAQ